ncbi:MAG: MotA/TolQ/ExbB proton channel family protein [Flavobacteriales bacterium]|nr:MotA/TolQ/ExbB proton channel family protein [Flavobacteriales bacterium]
MSNQKNLSGLSRFFAGIVIILALALGIFIFLFILGASDNFDEEGHPKNIIGIMYKGGFIVPILIALLITVIAISIERLITISKAKGKGSLESFIHRIKGMLASDQIDNAIAECDKQKGSLANVMRSGLEQYKLVVNDSSMDKEAKEASITKELEEATSLELPMLSKNLPVLSTAASIGTLVGLIGTVIGMIRAFAALSAAGQPDTSALATGISEALVNTGLGITGSTFAIIFYNVFSTRIDALTYSMDEAGFSIMQTLKAHK